MRHSLSLVPRPGHAEPSYIILPLYVDDGFPITNDTPELLRVIAKLRGIVELTHEGEAHSALGMRITRNRSKRLLFLDQTTYVNGIVDEFGLKNANPAESPIGSKKVYSRKMSPTTNAEKELMKAYPYLRLLGRLMYAMLGTRPDIAFAIGTLSQFGSNPGLEHWTGLKRVVRYLKGTADYALTFDGSSGDLTLMGYSDSDWGSCPDSRRSVAAYAFMMGGAAISWSSKKQPTVALSTVEAEYMAAAHAARHALWLRNLLEELGFNLIDPTDILSDSQGCIALAKDPVLHARAKHIDLRHHFLRERVRDQSILLHYIPDPDNIADALTKSVPTDKHAWCTNSLGLLPRGAIEEGC